LLTSSYANETRSYAENFLYECLFVFKKIFFVLNQKKSLFLSKDLLKAVFTV